MNTISKIEPNFLTYEGYRYLEHEGVFYKGCKRCGGEGHYAFNGEHDRCYMCDDTSAKLGESFTDEAAAQKWCHGKALRAAATARRKEREYQQRETKMQAKRDEVKASDPEVYDFLMGIDLGDEYGQGRDECKFAVAMKEVLTFHSMVDKPFTAKMLQASRNEMEQRVQRATDAAAHPAPEGRASVTGEIVAAKVQESDYGVAYKILVKDDEGYKVWCSLPKAQKDEAYEFFLKAVETNGHDVHDFGSAVWFLGTAGDQYFGVKGMRITFTATLKRSDRDQSFAFGSRPTQGMWIRHLWELS